VGQGALGPRRPCNQSLAEALALALIDKFCRMTCEGIAVAVWCSRIAVYVRFPTAIKETHHMIAAYISQS